MEGKTLKLDDLDLSLMRLLVNQGKLALKELSKELSVPPSTVHSRLKRLEREGIIRRYTIQVDHKRFGLELMAFVMIRFRSEHEDLDQVSVAKIIGELSRVQEVHILAGEWDILLKVRATSIDDLGDLVVNRLKKIRGVGQTVTYIVLNTVKENNSCIF